MTQTVPGMAELGSGYSGCSVAYAVYSLDGTEYSASTTTGVSETNVPGNYNVASGVVAPDTGGRLVFIVNASYIAEAPIEPVLPTSASIWSYSSRTITGGSVGTVNDKSGYSLSASGVDAILDEPISRPSAVFAWGSATLRNIVAWMGAMSRDKLIQGACSLALRNEADTANIASASTNDDGTSACRGEFG